MRKKVVFKKGYCEKLRKHLSKGKSYTSFASIVGANRNTLFNWERSHPDWKIAKDLGKAQWEVELAHMNRQTNQLWASSE